MQSASLRENGLDREEYMSKGTLRNLGFVNWPKGRRVLVNIKG